MSSTGTVDSSPARTWSASPIDWPATPPPAPDPSPWRHPGPAALLGLLVGALVVGGLWLGASLLRTPPAVPGGDAARACTLLGDLPEFTAESLTRYSGSELRTAGDLSATAARADQRYSRLADATRQAYLGSIDLDARAVNRHVEIALSECR